MCILVVYRYHSFRGAKREVSVTCYSTRDHLDPDFCEKVSPSIVFINSLVLRSRAASDPLSHRLTVKPMLNRYLYHVFVCLMCLCVGVSHSDLYYGGGQAW